MELNEQQEAWAKSLIGSDMRTSSTGLKMTAKAYKVATRGNGIWFYSSENFTGPRTYKQFPRHLKPQLSSPISGTHTGRFSASQPMRSIMEPEPESRKMRRDPVVVAYLQEIGFDEEGLPDEKGDPYSTAVSIIAAALDYAFDAVDQLGGKEGNIMVDVARALLKGDPDVGGDHWDFETALETV